MLFDSEFEEVRFLQDPASGLRAVLAVHSTVRGPAFGGIRRLVYPSEHDAVADALRLAEGMSLKCAAVGLSAGGAKCVVLDHDGLDRPAAYHALGRAVAQMGGRYVCGPDVGTTEDDLDQVRAVTDRVNPKGNDAGASTAAGVLAGIRGVLQVLEGTSDVAGRSFVVQGLGAVGLAVAKALHGDGARVAGTDVAEAARGRAREAGIEVIRPDAATATACDVFVPCALGGVLTEDLASSLPARAVCGSANNQLADPKAAGILAARGVLYAPDFMVNSGAVIEGVHTIRDGATDAARAEARRHIGTIEDQVREVLEAADGASTLDVALARARSRL